MPSTFFHAKNSDIILASNLKKIFSFKSSLVLDNIDRLSCFRLSGLNFINVLLTAFAPADPESVKTY